MAYSGKKCIVLVETHNLKDASGKFFLYYKNGILTTTKVRENSRLQIV